MGPAVSAEVIVCGSLNMDLVARVAQLPRPGETVVGASLTRLPGGKGLNQAVAAARMGATVAMVGARGDDADGATLAALLLAEGIDTRDLRVRDTRRMPDAHTGLAQVIVAADGENSIVVHGGANLTLTAEEVLAAFAVPASATLLQAAPVRAAPARVALAQLETPLVAVAGFFEAAREAGRCQAVIVTLGAEGAWLVTGEDAVHFPAPVVTVVDTTGAGDCFCGVLAAALAQGLDLEVAIARAVAAASRAVTRPGAAPSMPRALELDTF